MSIRALLGAILFIGVAALAWQTSEAAVAKNTHQHNHHTHPMVEASGAATASAQSLSEDQQQLLASHNKERAKFGAAPLIWSDQLARDSESWAAELAKRGVMQHASADVRKKAGENLWVGTTGYYLPWQMIQSFIDEKKYFKPGVFPNVATTGNWVQVGHYTQLVWPETKEVGCALADGKQDTFLVCRYMPAGNIVGVPLGK
jgi:uncharacterized protein YkwD